MPQKKSAKAPAKRAVKKRVMSTTHKASLAQGRSEGRVIRQYLDAIKAGRQPGRPQTPASLQKSLAAIESEIGKADSLRKLHLFEKQKVLKAKLAAKTATTNVEQLEKHFIEVASGYGERKGISYGSWRKAGVSAEILKKAKVERTRG